MELLQSLLEDYCLAIMCRFAHSEKSYLAELSCKVQSSNGVSCLVEVFGRLVVPDGGLHSPLILKSRFNALELSSFHSKVLIAPNTVASFLS